MRHGVVRSDRRIFGGFEPDVIDAPAQRFLLHNTDGNEKLLIFLELARILGQLHVILRVRRSGEKELRKVVGKVNIDSGCLDSRDLERTVGPGVASQLLDNGYSGLNGIYHE